MSLFKRRLKPADALNIIPAVALANIATGGAEGRKTRRAARQERIRKRQAAKTARQEQRQAARASRQAQRQEARATRQAVRQAARLQKLQQRKAANEELQNMGTEAEASKAGAIIRQPKTAAKIKAYVESQGGQIPENAAPEEIAAMAEEMRTEEITDTQDTLNEELQPGDEAYTPDEAENYLFDMYDAEAFDGDDVSNFDPLTAAAVKAASRKGFELVAKRRAAQGKKTLGMTPEELNKLLKPDYSDKPATSDVGKVLEAGSAGYKSAAVRTNTDTIIVVVLVLLVIGAGIYIAMKKK